MRLGLACEVCLSLNNLRSTPKADSNSLCASKYLAMGFRPHLKVCPILRHHFSLIIAAESRGGGYGDVYLVKTPQGSTIHYGSSLHVRGRYVDLVYIA